MTKISKLLCALCALLILTAPASAIFSPNVYGYDKTVDYMAEMIAAAEDGGSYALAMGDMYETQRNNKIRTMGLAYDETDFFGHGKTGKEILALIDAYRNPPQSEPTMTYIGRYYITGYDTCAACCGKWAGGPTASGVMPTVNHTVAMCSDYPFGTKIYIDGMGYYTVEDRGVGRNCVDVFCSNHTECYAITGYRDVYLVKEG